MKSKPDLAPTGLVTAAIAVVVVLVAVGVVFLLPAGAEPISGMEYAVWGALIGTPSDDVTRHVVEPVTVALVDGKIAGIDVRHDVDALLREKGVGPDLRACLEEATRDFLQRNGESRPIENRLDPKLGAVLVSAAARDAVFDAKGRADFAELHRRYGGEPFPAVSLYRFSRVGFSADGRYALVYWGQSQHSTTGAGGGAGGFGFYFWNGEDWVRELMLVTWIS